MAIIALEGMQFYAYHGFYEEERIIGNRYQVDVYVHATPLMPMPTKGEDINLTVNYETIYQMCKLEMKKPSQLLETVAQRILTRIKTYYKDLKEEAKAGNAVFPVQLTRVDVRVSKFQPPLGGPVERAYVEISEVLSK